MIDSSAGIVLRLLNKALNPSRNIGLPDGINWDEVLSLAYKLCVSGYCLEAMELLPVGCIPKVQLLKCIGQSEMQKRQYQTTWAVACKLDKMWAAEGISATVLKGRTMSQYYTVPHHRFSCDLDLFIEFGWDRACKVLEKEGVQLGYEVYKEVEFTLDGVYVECHRYITPVRGNKQLQVFERYLRLLLDCEQPSFFDGTTLVCPPLMFTVMLYIEHALGDFLHGHLSLKEIVDWVVLRKQEFSREWLESRCKEFKFDRFLKLIDAFADVVEGKIDYSVLPLAYKDAFDEVFVVSSTCKTRSWFLRRVDLFFDIVKNRKKFKYYGYMSMPAFLFNSVWTHFFNKKVNL